MFSAFNFIRSVQRSHLRHPSFLLQCSPSYDLIRLRSHFVVHDTRSSLLSNSILSRLLYQQRSGRFVTGPLRFSSGLRLYSTQQQPDDKSDRPKRPPWLEPSLLQAFGIAVLSLLLLAYSEPPSEKNGSSQVSPFGFISWDLFVKEMLAKGEVESIVVHSKLAEIRLHPGAVVEGKKLNKPFDLVFSMKIDNPADFEAALRRAEEDLNIPVQGRVEVTYAKPSAMSRVVSFLFTNLLAFLVLSWLFRGLRGMKGGGNPFTDPFGLTRGLQSKFTTSQGVRNATKGIEFKDVAGMRAAKQEVMEFMHYLRSPEKFQQLGAKLPRGALLTGPPGTGKTLLVKALAAEANVPFISLAGSEFMEIIGGLGAKRMRDLFKEAREKAPCIIFIDEIDTIGRTRSQNSSGGNSEREQTLNQLLVEMDGMDTRAGIIIFGATNRSDLLDRALLRPGRFDRHIFIDLPTMDERLEIFSLYLGKYKLAPEVWKLLPTFANLSPGMSGADIANICNEAALNAAKLGKAVVEPVDFNAAMERVVAGAAKKSRVLSDAEKRRVAYHEAGHAVVGWIMQHAPALLKVTIVPRTAAALGFAQLAPKENQLFSADEMFARLCVMLGGRIAESIIFNQVSTGAQDDLKRATDLVYKQVQVLGMSPVIGHMSFDVRSEDLALGHKPYSQWMSQLMDEEANRMLFHAAKEVERLLTEHKEDLVKLAEALLKKETLTYAEVRQIIGAPPHGDKLVSDYSIH